MDCELYLLTPRLRHPEGFADRMQDALATGLVSALLLRPDGQASDTEIRALVSALQPIARTHDVAFMLEGAPHVARAMQCDGVHVLPIADADVTNARRAMGDEAQLGVSCGLSRDSAMRAGESGVDYVAFDTTLTPDEEGEPAADLIRWWSIMMELPVVALAGPGSFAQACEPYVAAGADFLAVSDQVWDHSGGAGVAVRDLVAAIAAIAPGGAGPSA